MNNLSRVDIKDLRNLKFLMLHQNSITSNSLTRAIIYRLPRLTALWASYNNIEHIQDYSFTRCYLLYHLLLNNNRLKRITKRTFSGAFSLKILFLSDNPIEYIADGAFFHQFMLKRLYLLQTNIKTLNVKWFGPLVFRIGTAVQIYPTENAETIKMLYLDMDLMSGYSSTGFRCFKEGLYIYCNPCLSGSYITYHASINEFLCNSCPAGGFYQDALAFYGERAYGNGCQMCDNGTFVRTAPGRRKEDCKPCPEGTKSDMFAGFRACRCQYGFYRLDRFDKCYPCPESGVTCFNGSMTLKAGYYWEWVSKSEKDYYINFTNDLQVFDNTYDRDLVHFNGSFPKHYQCPRSESCLGGLDADCAEGYTGPLCAVCDKRYYQLVANCFKCPEVHWLIFQICAIVLVVMFIIYVVFKGKQRKAGAQRSLTDIILARLKIIVSFYQISSGTLDAFSYVKWPSALTQMSEYANFVQLNILQIAPLHCLNSRLKMDAYADLVITCSITAGVILIALAYYHKKRVHLSKSAAKSSLQSELDTTKEACYRNVFLFIFVTYPQTCSKIFQMLPASCHKICQDSSQQQCTSYLKADYSITCFTEKYNQYVILAYAALIYPFAVPLLTAAVLWKYHYKRTLVKAANGDSRDGKSRRKTEEENYNTSVDGIKKVIGKDVRMCQKSSTSRKESHVIKKRDNHLEVISEEQDSVTIHNQIASPKESPNLKDIHFMVDEVKNDQIQPDGKNPDENQMSRNEKTSRKVSLLPLSKAVRALSDTKKVFRNKRGSTHKVKDRRSGRSVVTTLPIVAGMSFIFENYAESCWFWETIEMTRKLLLMSTLALIGAEGRNSLGVASMLSGCYAILHAHFMPIPDKFEHALQLTSLLVTFANTCIGMMLKIDQGALLDADAKIMDSVIITVLLVTANVMVTALVVVKYSVAVGRSIYYLIKNPQCSLTCCLSIMLTVDEVQSEARSINNKSGWRTKSIVNTTENVMEDTADYGLTEFDIF